MEQHRDDRIVCVGCGTTFLFSSAEAAHYAERGLAAPPKRCKECRRARKEQRDRGELQGPRGDMQRSGNARFAPRGEPNRDPRTRMPLHTGDVNEYRSPMQDGFRPSGVAAPTYGGAGFQGGRGRPRGRPSNNDGNYRAPSFQGRGDSPRPGPGGGERHRHAPRVAAPERDASPPPARSEKRARPMFAITCKSCGTESQVPFKPDEDRDVFCQACYRARKPA